MTTTKTLMLAAFAALSLSMGTAMAQDGSGGSFPDYQSMRLRTVAPAAAANTDRGANPVQSGSSDADTFEPGAAHSPAYIFNHHLYGAGGVAG